MVGALISIIVCVAVVVVVVGLIITNVRKKRGNAKK